MKSFLKWLSIAFASIVVLVGLLFGWASWKTSQTLKTSFHFQSLDIATTAQKDLVVGERIVTIRNGCTECHGVNLAGAKVIDDPAMGVIWGSNITPAALKDWSDEEIAQAIRNGISREGHPFILMPSHDYQNLSKDDLASTVAYLRSVPAVEQPNTPIRLGPLARVLYALGKLPTLIPAAMLEKNQTGFAEKPREEASLEFGRYLIDTACIGCHGHDLRGGPIPGGPPSWPAASDLRGLVKNQWTKESFIQTMRSGQNPSGKSLRPPMPVALTQKMTDFELEAMWKYLETVEL